MASAAPDTATPIRLSRNDQRLQTRQRILDAVLEIMVEEGMRAVRHRAVADRAGVSLGSTTYHFVSIEELITSAFDYWRSRRQLVDNPFYREIVALLAPYDAPGVPAGSRLEVATRILELSVGYLVDQVCRQRQDRILELAFFHESMRSPALRELVLDGWAAQQAFLQRVHTRMGSAWPEEDALATSMLFRQWEQSAIMVELADLDPAAIERSLRRHLSLCFGLALPAVAGA